MPPVSLPQVVSSPNLGGPSSPSLSRFHSSPGPPGLEDSEPSGPIGVYSTGGGGSAGPASPTAAAAAYEAAADELFVDSLASCRTEPSEDQEVARIMTTTKTASAAAAAAAAPRRRVSDDAPPLLAQASVVQPLTQVASSRSATPIQGGFAQHPSAGGNASRSASPAPGHLQYHPHTKQAALAGGAAPSPSLAAAGVVQAASSSATAKLTANRHTTVMSAPLTAPATSSATAGGSSDPLAAAFAHLGSTTAADSAAGAGREPQAALPPPLPLSHSAAGAARLPYGHSADSLPQVAGGSQQESPAAAAAAAGSGGGSETVVILPRMMSVNQGAIFQGPGAGAKAGGTAGGGAGAGGAGQRPGSPGGSEGVGQQPSSGPLPKVAVGPRGRGAPAHDASATTDHQPPPADASQHTTTSLLPAIPGSSGPHHQHHHHQHGSHNASSSTPPLNTNHAFRSTATMMHHPHRAPLYANPSTHTGKSRDLLGYISSSLVTPMDNVLGPLSGPGPGRASHQRTAHHPRSPGSRMVPGLGVSLRDLAGVNDVRVQQRRGEGGGSGGGHGGGHGGGGGMALPLELDDGAPPLEDHALSAPSLQDINYILSRWTARCDIGILSLHHGTHYPHKLSASSQAAVDTTFVDSRCSAVALPCGYLPSPAPQVGPGALPASQPLPPGPRPRPQRGPGPVRRRRRGQQPVRAGDALRRDARRAAEHPPGAGKVRLHVGRLPWARQGQGAGAGAGGGAGARWG